MNLVGLVHQIYAIIPHRTSHSNIIFFRVKLIYVGSLTLFAVSMFLLATFPSQLGVLILSVPAGIIYSTMLTVPFLLMAKWHGSGAVSLFL